MRELLALHRDSLAAWESRAVREPWSSTPVRVDVTAYSNQGHVPYGVKNGLWGRVPDFRRALPLLPRIWQPYLDGKATFDEVIQQYAAEF